MTQNAKLERPVASGICLSDSRLPRCTARSNSRRTCTLTSALWSCLRLWSPRRAYALRASCFSRFVCCCEIELMLSGSMRRLEEHIHGLLLNEHLSSQDQHAAAHGEKWWYLYDTRFGLNSSYPPILCIGSSLTNSIFCVQRSDEDIVRVAQILLQVYHHFTAPQ